MYVFKIMLTEEQSKLIKKQLIEQINRWNIDEQSKNNAKEYILKLNEKELEEFLIKNKLLKEVEKPTIEKKGKDCIFCLIIDNKIPSYKIDENETSLAVLDIKPLSRGHVIVIPKKHVSLNKIPVSSFSLAKEISKKIKKTLKPKEVSISTSLLFGHEIINIIPSYENEINERKEAKKEELEELQKLLTEKKIVKEDKKLKKTIEPKLYKFPRRIP